ncbi:MAG TPA: hypothetical protein VHO70_16465, partial [Chitinispirillaceae bacterium]|nr:hypothetical protein [Chitinispirillaceae bacterium]
GAIKMVQTFKHVSLRALCAGTVNFTGEPFEYGPFECGAGFSCFFGSSSMIRTDFDVTLRGPAKWNASYLGKDSTISSPQILFCNFGITIPFILPVLASHITPELAIKAGPISFRPSGRQQYHPFGGPLGPLVSATLLGTIK